VKYDDVYNGKIKSYQKEINDFWKIKWEKSIIDRIYFL
jgi:hypothetical protein